MGRDHAHHGPATPGARPDRLAEPEQVAVRLSRWLALITTVPAGALALVQGMRDGTMSGWLVGLASAVLLATVLLLALWRASTRLQAAVLAMALTATAWLALVHYGPILGVGTLIAASCVCWTFFFGAAGMIGGVGATLIVLALVAWRSLDGPLGPGWHFITPPTVLVWLRTWLTVAGSTIFLSGVIHAVQGRYRKLLEAEIEARHAAEEATRARDEFLSLASHELRTPLTSLKLQVQALGAEHRAEDRVVQSLDRQVRRLERLVSSFLDVTSLDVGRALVRDTVDLGALANDVIAAHDLELRRSGSTVALHVPRAVIGRWDRALLEQVLVQLVGNAIKFGAGRPIDVTIDGDDRGARVVVRDHGDGIVASERERIFERFHRGVSWKHHGGLGLGLHLAQRIARMHAGTLRVDSEPGAGSTFTLVLPRAGDEREARVQPVLAGAPAVPTPT
ncbi:sensor histidine kinase [Sandaracinus amylolyticus]|uniref:histidine kinase n=1 Tax=Sandaracinus amylolyticus TaxID=927083 RepID=A0A0F6SE98_9BACT|nr:HAMP domain-containing sensor histidine kinase [Sandaracinus amylolyticus]AKF04819.1 Two-component sensor histidine kinase [Sandaracinus amylolyticus]